MVQLDIHRNTGVAPLDEIGELLLPWGLLEGMEGNWKRLYLHCCMGGFKSKRHEIQTKLKGIFEPSIIGKGGVYSVGTKYNFFS